MTASRMPGRRVDGVRDLTEPGDYCLMSDGNLWMVLPSGDEARTTERHRIVEHENGTVTVSPAIFDPGGWFGRLQAGVWRAA